MVDSLGRILDVTDQGLRSKGVKDRNIETPSMS